MTYSMMSKENNMFTYTTTEINESLDNMFAPIELSNIFHDFPSFSELTEPVNVYTDEKGDYNIELAVCGLTKEQLEITVENGEDGFNYLTVSNKTDKETDKEGEKRQYKIRKLKYFFKKFGFVIENKYDIDKIFCSVENGLLKIVIPTKTPKEKRTVEIHG